MAKMGMAGGLTWAQRLDGHTRIACRRHRQTVVAMPNPSLLQSHRQRKRAATVSTGAGLEVLIPAGLCVPGAYPVQVVRGAAPGPGAGGLAARRAARRQEFVRNCEKSAIWGGAS